MLLNKIKADALEARKARNTDKASLLTTLFAEAARVGKDAGGRDSTDDETVRVVRKFLKGIDESLLVLTQPEARTRALVEKAVIEGYLPVQLTGEALTLAVRGLVAALPAGSAVNMGTVMKALKEMFAGAYDGKEAKSVVIQVLSESAPFVNG